MPVTSEVSISGPFTPNGVTTAFPFDFKAAAANEVVAIDQDGEAISTALYSVEIDGDEGGTLTFSAAPTLADYSAIYVLSEPALTQPSDFDNTGPSFNPAALTRALDRAAIRDLKIKREVDRSIKAGYGATPPVLGSYEDGQVAAFVGGEIVGVTNDPASAAASAALAGRYANADTDAPITGAPSPTQRGAKYWSLATASTAALVAADRAATVAARLAAEEAAAVAQQLANATIFKSWALAAAASHTAGDPVIIFEDGGTHTDPVVGGTVSNSGVFIYSASPAGLERVADTDGARAHEAADRAENAAEEIRNSILSTENLIGDPDLSVARILGSGAENLGDWGILIPAGETGNSTFLQPRYVFDGAAHEGRRIRIILSFAVVDWDRNSGVGFHANTAGGEVVRTGSATIVEKVSSATRKAYWIDYEIQGDETGFRPFLNAADPDPAASDQSATVEFFSLIYLSALPGDLVTGADDMLNQRLLAAGYARAADVHFGFVNALSELTPAPQMLSGAVARNGPDGRVWGWTIPVGQTGHFSLVQAVLPLMGLGALLEGRTVRVTFGCDTSDNYNLLVGRFWQVNRGAGAVGLTIVAERNEQTETNRLLISFDAVMDGTEQTLQPFLNNYNPDDEATAETYLVVTDVTIEIVASPSDALTLLEENVRLGAALRGAVLAAQLSGSGGASPYQMTVTVADSGGDFDDLEEALASITDASPSKRYEIALLTPGEYVLSDELVTKNDVDINGRGRREDFVIKFWQPNDASAADITAKSVVFIRTRTTLRNVTIDGKNVRYGAHPETASAVPFNAWAFENCVVIHRGNADAVNNTWPVGSQGAVGCGKSDGEVSRARNSVFIGRGFGLSYHTQSSGLRGYAPTEADYENCTFIATEPGYPDLKIVPVTVGAGDTARIVGCSYRWLQCETSQWTSADTTTNRAQIAISGHGNTPAVFQPVIDGPAEGAKYRPFFSDEEQRFMNSTGAEIAMGSVLARDDAYGVEVRLMTSADDPKLYAGVAWEDIANGATGRVKTGGLLPLATDVLQDFTTEDLEDLAVGDTFSIDPGTSGRVIVGGSQGLLEVVRVLNVPSVVNMVVVKVAR